MPALQLLRAKQRLSLSAFDRNRGHGFIVRTVRLEPAPQRPDEPERPGVCHGQDAGALIGRVLRGIISCDRESRAPHSGAFGPGPLPGIDGAAAGRPGRGWPLQRGPPQGKAANLWRSPFPNGLLVPKGCVVTTAAFSRFLRHNEIEDTAKMLWDTLDPEEPAHLWETSMTLREAALAGALPPSVLSPPSRGGAPGRPAP